MICEQATKSGEGPILSVRYSTGVNTCVHDSLRPLTMPIFHSVTWKSLARCICRCLGLSMRGREEAVVFFFRWLASLEFCRAYRSVSTLRVRIQASTPRSLWSPTKTQTRPNTRTHVEGSDLESRASRSSELTWALFRCCFWCKVPRSSCGCGVSPCSIPAGV